MSPLFSLMAVLGEKHAFYTIKETHIRHSNWDQLYCLIIHLPPHRKTYQDRKPRTILFALTPPPFTKCYLSMPTATLLGGEDTFVSHLHVLPQILPNVFSIRSHLLLSLFSTLHSHSELPSCLVAPSSLTISPPFSRSDCPRLISHCCLLHFSYRLECLNLDYSKIPCFSFSQSCH